jgi:hypothetical protein
MMWWVASTEWLRRAWSTTAWRSARSLPVVFDTVCILREIRRYGGQCDPEARALAVRSCFTDDVMFAPAPGSAAGRSAEPGYNLLEAYGTNARAPQAASTSARARRPGRGIERSPRPSIAIQASEFTRLTSEFIRRDPAVHECHAPEIRREPKAHWRPSRRRVDRWQASGRGLETAQRAERSERRRV